jgi:hypothetical protein
MIIIARIDFRPFDVLIVGVEDAKIAVISRFSNLDVLNPPLQRFRSLLQQSIALNFRLFVALVGIFNQAQVSRKKLNYPRNTILI